MVATRRIPPPPLQLEDDNTRYGRQLLQSRVVEKDSFFAQVYETDWRKLIIIVASINLIRYFFSALLIAFSFNELEQVDNALHSRKRTAIFATVGLMYVSTGLVEIFGIVSTVMRRLRLIRIYVHLAFGSALAVTITGVLVAFAYFEFAEDVVNQCVSIANKGKIVVKLLYQRNADTLVNPAFSPEDAQRQCFNAWSSESSSQILYVFTFYFLPSAFTSLLVYTYYRQCTDPYHPATLCSQMAAESGGHPYTRVPAPGGYVSPYFSPLHLNVVSQQRSSGANSGNSRAAADSRSSPGFSNRRRSALATNSTSGRRSARRARVNWFSKPRNYSKVSLNSSTLSASGLSPGPPSFNGGHLGYAYEMPYGQPLNSTKSDGKYA
ncbi:hypothetical protein F5051DRAFT_402976 [Lentinula edodes]|nr:hypothetical protein F5051DRAFT_402976 [Lentinula edodes]